ncbi:MAG: hypothetical protein GY722_29425 [bacterium]|nr:hypothetical protein [bacterium]
MSHGSGLQGDADPSGFKLLNRGGLTDGSQPDTQPLRPSSLGYLEGTMVAVDLSPPQNWQDFECLCREFWRRLWGDPLAAAHGRPGAPQNGVDIYGRRGAEWHAVQCKKKEWHKRLGAAQIRAEADKARKFSPGLSCYILAAIVLGDRSTQEDVRAINAASEITLAGRNIRMIGGVSP